MTDAAAIGLGGPAGIARLLVGSLVLLAPGLAAVDRFLGLRWRTAVFAPVFSFTLVPLAAIVLDLVLQLPVTALFTVLECLAWVVLLEWPRRQQLWAWLRRPRLGRLAAPRRRDVARAGVLLVVLGGVAVVHALPHLPGPDGNVWTAYPTLADRVWNGLVLGHDYPYPVHVDEHVHLAREAAVVRQGHIDIHDPYTGAPYATPLLSVQGFREERGFHLTLAQIHEVTGLSLVAEARIIPPLQAALLAAVLYATLSPAPGALASAALVAVVPTTVLFIGPDFLVPSAFALPWVVTALHVSLRATGGRRLAALALLETAAYFQHLVLGTVVLFTAAGASLARPGRMTDRLALAAATFLPLLWIGPLVWDEIVGQVLQEVVYPFSPSILLAAGLLAAACALVGGALAILKPDDALRPHRVFLGLGLGILASMLVSMKVGHHSDATYYRLVATLFVCVAALAGLLLGWAADWIALAALPTGADKALLATIVVALLTLVVAAPGIHTRLATPYYHIQDDSTWPAAHVLAQAGLGEHDVVLCDPWLAPLYNAVSGAHVFAVLLPGNPPVNGDAWTSYLSTRGANATWLKDRGIDVVVAPFPPKAPHSDLGHGVYRLNETA